MNLISLDNVRDLSMFKKVNIKEAKVKLYFINL